MNVALMTNFLKSNLHEVSYHHCVYGYKWTDGRPRQYQPWFFRCGPSLLTVGTNPAEKQPSAA